MKPEKARKIGKDVPAYLIAKAKDENAKKAYEGLAEVREDPSQNVSAYTMPTVKDEDAKKAYKGLMEFRGWPTVRSITPRESRPPSIFLKYIYPYRETQTPMRDPRFCVYYSNVVSKLGPGRRQGRGFLRVRSKICSRMWRSKTI